MMQKIRNEDVADYIDVLGQLNVTKTLNVVNI